MKRPDEIISRTGKHFIAHDVYEHVPTKLDNDLNYKSMFDYFIDSSKSPNYI